MVESVSLAKWIQLLQELAHQGTGLLSTHALQRLSGLSPEATRKVAWRLVQHNLLVRLGPGLYGNRFQLPRLEAVASLVGRPAYLSRESALSERGVLSQMPAILTCVTTGKPRRLQTPLGDIRLYHLREELFFGYLNRNGILWAQPEKAVLDWVYLDRKAGLPSPSLDELRWTALSSRTLRAYGRRYPKSVWREIERWMSAGQGEGKTDTGST
jgi:predicted transcriptional regulator of viral defense system